MNKSVYYIYEQDSIEHQFLEESFKSFLKLHIEELSSSNFYNRKLADIIILNFDLVTDNIIHFIETSENSNSKILVVCSCLTKDFLIKLINLTHIIGVLPSSTNSNELLEIISRNMQLSNNITLTNDFYWNKTNKELYNKSNEIISLTKNEKKLIDFLVKTSSYVNTSILENNLFYELKYSSKRIQNLKTRINKKVGIELISNAYGQGYRINKQASCTVN